MLPQFGQRPPRSRSLAAPRSALQYGQFNMATSPSDRNTLLSFIPWAVQTADLSNATIASLVAERSARWLRRLRPAHPSSGQRRAERQVRRPPPPFRQQVADAKLATATAGLAHDLAAIQAVLGADPCRRPGAVLPGELGFRPASVRHPLRAVAHLEMHSWIDRAFPPVPPVGRRERKRPSPGALHFRIRASNR